MKLLQHYQKQAVIQSLWGGYGEIARWTSDAPALPPVIVKHVKLAQVNSHPRGWASQLSHQRKLSSYQNEIAFYQEYASMLGEGARVPEYLHSISNADEVLLLMEDLDDAGFTLRHTTATTVIAKQGLTWLANFHARFLNENTAKLWPQGTYWHLATRPDELKAMPDSALKQAASQIDNQLKQAKYLTLVHGDAKLANFCFHRNEHQVAAVDFQYVGRGAPVKDVAYFIGSCFFGDKLSEIADDLFEYYLTKLRQCLTNKAVSQALEQECRRLYPFAWADFERFMQGWSPGHKKLGTYSAEQTAQALKELNL